MKNLHLLLSWDFFIVVGPLVLGFLMMAVGAGLRKPDAPKKETRFPLMFTHYNADPLPKRFGRLTGPGKLLAVLGLVVFFLPLLILIYRISLFY